MVLAGGISCLYSLALLEEAGKAAAELQIAVRLFHRLDRLSSLVREAI